MPQLARPAWWRERRWRAVRDTPLAALADALVNRGGLHDRLVELGLTSTAPEPPVTMIDCGFDTQNRWYWLDVRVAPALASGWLDTRTQRRVRELLDVQLLYFKPKDEVIRIWFPTRRTRGPGPAAPG